MRAARVFLVFIKLYPASASYQKTKRASAQASLHGSNSDTKFSSEGQCEICTAVFEPPKKQRYSGAAPLREPTFFVLCVLQSQQNAVRTAVRQAR